ncbi:MAG: MarR family winged helix-turn-helix transcriptional regulator [Bauldia sp.]
MVTQQFDQALRPFGLRATQLPLLTAAAGGPVPLAQLAAALGMERTTMLRNVRPLVRQGLVDIRREEGGRRDELHPTAAGQALLVEAYPAWQRVQERLLQESEPELRTTLARLGHSARTAKTPRKGRS